MSGDNLGTWRKPRMCLALNPDDGSDFPGRCVRSPGHEGAHRSSGNGPNMPGQTWTSCWVVAWQGSTSLPKGQADFDCEGTAEAHRAEVVRAHGVKAVVYELPPMPAGDALGGLGATNGVGTASGTSGPQIGSQGRERGGAA